MDQRSARSYGDSRSGRRPDYDSEGVQGRFGRQEDWREAERKQAARKLTLREQVELEAAEMERERREAAERRAAASPSDGAATGCRGADAPSAGGRAPS